MAPHEYDFSINNLHIDLNKAAAFTGTPIRTRGKKRARSTQVDTPKPTNDDKRRPKPTPTQTPSSLSSSSFSPELRSRKRRKHPRPLCTIEKLPFDIMEQIFLECLNVNFPRALQRVGQILSTQRVYRHFSYRIYCANVHRNDEGVVTLTPPAKLRNKSERERITAEREEMWKVRSAGLTCRWATYAFFRTLHQQVTKSPNLWMGLFSCSIPRKLLSPPLSSASRKLLLSLASLGAKLDATSLAREDADSLWTWAASVQDFYVLQCLMDPRFGFKPSRQQRLEALERTRYDVDLVRLFKETRSLDPKNGWMWSLDWPEGWPIGDSKVEAELCERNGVEFARLKGLIDSGHNLREWKFGFGGEIPNPSVLVGDA